MGVTVTASRPSFPASYGIATDTDGMLDWEAVSAALAGAPAYWVATTRPDATPHLTPIWGAWVDAGLYIEGGDTTVWASNLAARPACMAGADHGGLHMTLRGSATVVEPDPDVFETVADGYAAKYPYRPSPPGRFRRIDADTVLAWSVTDLDSFATTPTRFRLERP